jgi:hypothetical protein
LVGESLDGSLKGLVAYQESLAENEDLELRLYLDRELSLGDVKEIEQTLVRAGMTLNEPLAYDVRIVAVRFKFTRGDMSKLAHIEVPGLLGWQLFDQREMKDAKRP